MTKHALPPAHKIGCYCPTCVLHEWDEHHAEMLEDISRADEAATVAKANDALARANAPFNEGDWAEYCIYTAAVNNRGAGVPEFAKFDCPDHPVDWRYFDVYGWLQSPMRQAQLDWQAQERTKLLELAREEGRQTGRLSSLEGGYSASSDLCGPSSTNKFEGTRYEALEETGDLPSMADVEALFQETFVLPDNANLREIKRFERACEDAALKGYGCSPVESIRKAVGDLKRHEWLGDEADLIDIRPGGINWRGPVIDDGSANPKQVAGDLKSPLACVPFGAVVQVAPVFANGAAKYGALNWRNLKIKRATYLAAALRHIIADLEGETIDPVENGGSGHPHIAHAIAGLLIVLDAEACGTLIDDRPSAGVGGQIMAAQAKGAL